MMLAQQETLRMVRDIMIGMISFAITAVLILGSGLQGSSLIG